MNRFTAAPQWVAITILLALLGLILYGLVAPPAARPPKRPAGVTPTDIELYRSVLGRMQAGQGYYPAASAEQRLRGYPLFPWVTVRPPALAELMNSIGGEDAAAWLLKLLAILCAVTAAIRLRGVSGSMPLVAGGAAVTVFAVAFPANGTFFHESWAGLLILLSLASWSKERYALSVVCGFAAVLIRELALPFLCVMLLMSLVGRRRREAGLWGFAVATIVGALVLHAERVSSVRLPTDVVSPGWVGGGGWPFILRMMREVSSLALLPGWVSAVFVPIALLGWASCRHPIALRALLYLVGMMVAFMFVGRPTNVYWGLLLAPLLPLGLIFAPRTLLVLARRAAARS